MQVLLQYLPVVEMQRDWQGKSWTEIIDEFPSESTKASTYILAMFQGPEPGKKQAVLNSNRY